MSTNRPGGLPPFNPNRSSENKASQKSSKKGGKIEQSADAEEEERRRKFQQSLDDSEVSVEHQEKEASSRVPSPFHTEFYTSSSTDSSLNSIKSKAVPSPSYSPPPPPLSTKPATAEKLPQSDQFWGAIDEPPDLPLPKARLEEKPSSLPISKISSPPKPYASRSSPPSKPGSAQSPSQKSSSALPISQKSSPAQSSSALPISQKPSPKKQQQKDSLAASFKEEASSMQMPASLEQEAGSMQTPAFLEEEAGSMQMPAFLEEEAGSMQMPAFLEEEAGSMQTPSSLEEEAGSMQMPAFLEEEAGSMQTPSSLEEEAESLQTPSSLEKEEEEAETMEVPSASFLPPPIAAEEEERLIEQEEKISSQHSSVSQSASPSNLPISDVRSNKKGKPTQKGEVIIPTPLPPSAGSFAQVAVQQANPYLNSDTFALFYQVVGSIYVLTQSTSGIAETRIMLNSPNFANSKFYGATITIEKYETAPDSLNIRLTGTEQAVSAFNQNLPSLLAAFHNGNFSFQIGRLEAEYETEKTRPVFRRKGKESGGQPGQQERNTR